MAGSCKKASCWKDWGWAFCCDQAAEGPSFLFFLFSSLPLLTAGSHALPSPAEHRLFLPPPPRLVFCYFNKPNQLSKGLGPFQKKAIATLWWLQQTHHWDGKPGAQLQLNTGTNVPKSQPLSWFLGHITWKDAEKVPKGDFRDPSSPVDEENQKVFDGKTDRGSGKVGVICKVLISPLHKRVWRILVASFPNWKPIFWGKDRLP